MLKRKYVIIVFLACCLTATLLMGITSSDIEPPEYDPWADLNDDGTVNILDAIKLAGVFGTSGDPKDKISLEYDSGWLNITDKTGHPITIVHNLNSTDVIVDIRGRTTVDGEVQQIRPGLRLNNPKYPTELYHVYTIEGTKYTWIYDGVQTSDGGYALAGWNNIPVYDYLLIRTGGDREIQWSKLYGGTGDEHCYSIVQTSDGGYALAGHTNSFGAGGYDFWLVKVDAGGTMQWNKTYGGTGSDEAYSVVQTSDGGYALAGYTYSYGAGDADFWLVKTNSTGDMQWNKTYGGPGLDAANSLVQTGDGGYALGGRGFAELAKTDASGNLIWNKTYGHYVYSLLQTYDGSYIMAGSGFSLVKADANGTKKWNKTYGGNEIAYCVIQTSDGGYALVGDAWLDALLVKTDANGTMLWKKTYGGTSLNKAHVVFETSDGRYAFAGRTHDFSDTAGNNAWMVWTPFETGLAWTDSTADSITLYRGENDVQWNYLRVKIWTIKENS